MVRDDIKNWIKGQENERRFMIIKVWKTSGKWGGVWKKQDQMMNWGWLMISNCQKENKVGWMNDGNWACG